MNLIYSYHAKKRMKQRGITELEIEHVLNCPSYIKKSFENTKEAVGEIKNRIMPKRSTINKGICIFRFLSVVPAKK